MILEMFIEVGSEAIWVWAFLCVSNILITNSSSCLLIGISDCLFLSDLPDFSGVGFGSVCLSRGLDPDDHVLCGLSVLVDIEFSLRARHLSVHWLMQFL